MAFTRIVAAWALVSCWFIGWEVARRRLDRAGDRLRGVGTVLLVEALWFVLFAALWFASLGLGQWPLVFGLLGLLLEWPLRFRVAHPGSLGRRAGVVAAGVGRVLAAGAICAWVFS